MVKTLQDFGIEVRPGAVGETYTQCPKCSPDRKKKRATPLAVNVDEGVWFCYHCGWSGSTGGKVEYLKPHWQQPEYRKPKKTPKSELPANVIEWFSRRGISEKTLVENKIGYDTVYMPQVEDFTTAIAFPYFKNGEHVNTKWRDMSKNFRLDPGAELTLYGLDGLTDGPVIWVEGEMDKLSLHEAGFHNCVSVPNGAPPETSKGYASKFDWLDLEAFESRENILFFDADAPGQKLEFEISRRLGRERCKRVVTPEGCKDANEILTQHGVSELRAAIANARDFPIEGVITGNDLRADVLKLHETGRQRGVSTGWADVDELYSVKTGELTIVTGIPNSGKSNWVDALSVNIAKEHGWRFAVFSPENQPVSEHASSICEKYSGVPFNKGPLGSMSAEDVDLCMDWVHKHFFWILPEEESWTLDNIIAKARAMVLKHGINCLILDPWNELEHVRPESMSETEYVSQCLSKIKKFAQKFNVKVFLVAHPTKLRKNDSGQYEVPTPYDISGSANFRNKADNCITVYRTFTKKGERPVPVDICIQKIRHRHIGTLGTAKLDFKYSTATYHTVKEQHYGRS